MTETVSREIAEIDAVEQVISSEEPHALIARLNQRRARHETKPRVFRVAWAIAGFVLTGCGVLMLAIPGPAFAVIPAGLAMLALEFEWAQRLLVPAIRWANAAKRKAQETTRLQKAFGMFAFAAGAGVCVCGQH
jgi:hypothetical protein